MKVTKAQLNNRYIPALAELSRQEHLTGKIAYACGRAMAKCEAAIVDIERSRVMILESRALKQEDGKSPKPSAIMKEDGKNEDGTAKMVPVLNSNGQPLFEYSFESPEKKQEAISAIAELENTEVDIDINRIPASEIIALKSFKDGGRVIFNLGDIIDHDK